jgi:translation initiation factor 3 subunit G
MINSDLEVSIMLMLSYVKITRRTKRTLQKSVVDHEVAERQKWAKFGQERGNKPGPDRATTTVGENVTLTISAGNKVRFIFSNNLKDLCSISNQAGEPERQPDMSAQLKKAGAGKVVCRLCHGDHFTAKCPYKGRLSEMDPADTGAGPDDDTAPPAEAPGPSTGKYIPPSQRAGAGRGAGERMGGSREDLPTLRVTNISEDTQENDLRELFGVFGRVARVYVGRDRDTGAGKGFAFVSFEDRSVAQKAMEKVNGKGYDNLILSVQWSRKSAPLTRFMPYTQPICRATARAKIVSVSFVCTTCTIYSSDFSCFAAIRSA